MDALNGFFSEDQAEAPAPPPVLARVVSNPRLPADAGLGLLGLLMQVAGSVMGWIAGGMCLVVLIAPPFPASMTLVALLSLARSVLHAQAGSALVHQGPAGVAKVNRYVLGAIAHTVFTLVLVLGLWDTADQLPVVVWLLLGLLLLAWPTALMLILRRKDTKAAIAAAEDAPVRLVAEDRSLTGLGILMVVSGAVLLASYVTGALFALTADLMQAGFIAILMLAVLGLYAARAFYGLRAGRIAVSGGDPHTFHRALDQYQTAANASVFVAGGVILISSLIGGAAGLLGFVFILPFLIAPQMWPKALKAYAERNLPEGTFSDETLPGIRKPRDAGLVGVGIVLLASGIHQLIMGLTPYIVGAAFSDVGVFTELSEAEWTAPITGLVATVAGWALINMLPWFRVAGLAYGLIVGGLAVWQVIAGWEALSMVLEFGAPQMLALTALQTGIALAFPLAVLWISLRHEEVGDDVADEELASAFD